MKSKKRKTKAEKRKKIEELLEIVTKECENASWHWAINSLDEKEFLSASVTVEKELSNTIVSGLISILIKSEGIQYGIEQTSFHRYGMDALFRAITSAMDRAGYKDSKSKSEKQENTTTDILLQIFKKFHISTLQLSKRYNNRQTLIAKDEYDVQDYLHALLKIHFNDIRPEEYTPSYAGSASRVDFLLKDEKVLIEIKYATSKLKDKKIGEQLILDIAKYKKHKNCKTLICFVYDPEFNIKNPYGLENDLSEANDKLNVKVYIYPK